MENQHTARQPEPVWGIQRFQGVSDTGMPQRARMRGHHGPERQSVWTEPQCVPARTLGTSPLASPGTAARGGRGYLAAAYEPTEVGTGPARQGFPVRQDSSPTGRTVNPEGGEHNFYQCTSSAAGHPQREVPEFIGIQQKQESLFQLRCCQGGLRRQAPAQRLAQEEDFGGRGGDGRAGWA